MFLPSEIEESGLNYFLPYFGGGENEIIKKHKYQRHRYFTAIIENIIRKIVK